MVGLTEVLFAVIVAWRFLGQSMTVAQLFGGVLVVAGIALVRLDELRGEGRLATTEPCEAPVLV